MAVEGKRKWQSLIQGTLKHDPPSFKLGRESMLQLSKVERDLFTDMEEQESGNYIVSGISKKITEQDFTAFSFAVGQLLYNQSYQANNLETNSGLTVSEAESERDFFRTKVYDGNIVASLNQLCRLAYGVDDPDSSQRKKIDNLVKVLDENRVIIQSPNSQARRESRLCACMDRFTDKDGAISYNLHLHPIFCYNVKNNFAELPQDIMKRLTKATNKKTLAHYRLIRLLSIQDKRKPFTRTLAELLSSLDLAEAYKSQKSRTEKQLASTLDDMVKIQIISKWEVSYTEKKGKKVIEKYTITLNEKFVKSIDKP